MHYLPLIKHLENFLPLSKEEKDLFGGRLVELKIKRKQKILREGQICRTYTFIVQGCFRMYGIDKNGFEHNIQFGAENDWIADIGSFYNQKPSKWYIEAIESGYIYQINQEDLYFLFTKIPKLNRIFKVLVETKYIELQNRVLQNLSSTAKDRYVKFLEQYSPLINRIPNIHIASYIGITPEFLSKIRKNLK